MTVGARETFHFLMEVFVGRRLGSTEPRPQSR